MKSRNRGDVGDAAGRKQGDAGIEQSCSRGAAEGSRGDSGRDQGCSRGDQRGIRVQQG